MIINQPKKFTYPKRFKVDRQIILYADKKIINKHLLFFLMLISASATE